MSADYGLSLFHKVIHMWFGPFLALSGCPQTFGRPVEARVTRWSEISAHISQTTGRPFCCSESREVHGGSINRAVVCRDAGQQYFIKTNAAPRVDMFAAEAEGLLQLAKSGAVRVPEPLCWGVADDVAYLVMEFLELESATEFSSDALGNRLAQLHQVVAPQFGWYRDNTIGSTPQQNAWADTWSQFWRDQRHGFQVDLAISQGFGGALVDKLEQVRAAVPQLLSAHRPAPSLLHGDLWGGNVAADTKGHPVIFDPAVYYGDRETDLAMTELFGGFSPRFYASYKNTYPLEAGYEVRRTLYNLYHVLNHLNLFGDGYAHQAEQMAERLLSELN